MLKPGSQLRKIILFHGKRLTHFFPMVKSFKNPAEFVVGERGFQIFFGVADAAVRSSIAYAGHERFSYVRFQLQADSQSMLLREGRTQCVESS